MFIILKNNINSLAILDLSSLIPVNFQPYILNYLNYFFNFINGLINKLYRCIAIYKAFKNVFLFFGVIVPFLLVAKNKEEGEIVIVLNL